MRRHGPLTFVMYWIPCLDIIVTGPNNEHHLRNLEAVLQRLAAAGLSGHCAKSMFMQPKVDYCGHEVSHDSLHKMPSKIEAVSLQDAT